MNPAFPLAGLLRLRQLQEEAAASDLAAAQARLNEISGRRNRSRLSLAGTAERPDTTTTLNAVAAARAAAGSMLTEMKALAQERQCALDREQKEFNAARARTIGLEKLETKHLAAAAIAELRVEQRGFDETASRNWQKDRNSS